MRTRIRLIVIISIFVLKLNLVFSEVTVPSKIKEVTLFSDQALIKREACLEVKKGLNEILLELEAFSLDKDSVSARVFGAGEVYRQDLFGREKAGSGFLFELRRRQRGKSQKRKNRR